MEEVLIIGGGIAGLSAAISFQKNGYQPIVYEAATALKPVGAGISLAPNAMRACQKLGIAELVKQAGRMVDELRITNTEHKLLGRINYAKYSSFFKEASVAIYRPDLIQLLADQLPEGSVHTGKQAVAFRQNKESVEVTFANGETVHAQQVVAADGIHSLFRKQLVPTSVERYAGYTCWRGIGLLPPEYPYPDTLVESWGKGQRLGIVPLTKGKVYWFAVRDARENDPAMKNATLQEITAFFKGWHAPYLSILQTTPPAQIFWNDIRDIAPLKRFAFDNVLLTGDAAHATTPNMGQGGCQALEDAAVLMDCLAAKKHVKEAFLAFEQKRLARTARVIRDSRSMGITAQLSNPFLVAVRDKLLSLLPDRLIAEQLRWLNKTNF